MQTATSYCTYNHYPLPARTAADQREGQHSTPSAWTSSLAGSSQQYCNVASAVDWRRNSLRELQSCIQDCWVEDITLLHTSCTEKFDGGHQLDYSQAIPQLPTLYYTSINKVFRIVVPKSKGTRLVATNIMEHAVLHIWYWPAHHFILVTKIILCVCFLYLLALVFLEKIFINCAMRYACSCIIEDYVDISRSSSNWYCLLTKASG